MENIHKSAQARYLIPWVLFLSTRERAEKRPKNEFESPTVGRDAFRTELLVFVAYIGLIFNFL